MEILIAVATAPGVIGAVVAAFILFGCVGLAAAADAAATVRCDADGIRDITFTLAADVTAGTWDFLNTMVVYFPSAIDVSDDAEGVGYYRMEKCMMPKATGITITAGDILFYSTVTNDVSNVTRAATDVPAATALEDAGTAATEVLADFAGDRLSRLTAKVALDGDILALSD